MAPDKNQENEKIKKMKKSKKKELQLKVPFFATPLILNNRLYLLHKLKLKTAEKSPGKSCNLIP